MIKNRKQMYIVIGAFALVLFLGGTTFAWFNYSRESATQEMIAGDIYMHFNEGTGQIQLDNIFPETKEEARARNDNYITFDIDGINSTNKIIYYEFVLDHGDEKESPKLRYNDSDLRFDLVELDSNGNEVSYLISNVGFDTLINKKIWVDTIDANTTTEIVKRYKLRMWLSEDVVISDTAPNKTYTTTDYPNRYATVKLIVSGDFQEKSNAAYYLLRENADTITQINFGNLSSDNNGKGLYRLYGTENDQYPIYYYRGEIDNNNVIFGGFCWQIVRTTDTGGIKMIYNGVATGDGKTCENTLPEDRIIGTSKFFENSYSMASIGYMYNAEYIFHSYSSISGKYFGQDIEYGDFDNNGTSEYRLINSINGYDENHHYSCYSSSASDTCATVKYFYNDMVVNNEILYHEYIELSDGELLDDALYKMTGNGTSEVKARSINQNYDINTKDSVAKEEIEDWFKTNLTNEVDLTKTNYTGYLEDTIWCNDRSFKSSGQFSLQESGWNPNGGTYQTYIYFGSSDRLYNNYWLSTTNVPGFTCPNETDQFRVGNSKAHLNYPVGLLTDDEAVLAGAMADEYWVQNTTFYLYTGGNYWLMSPSHVGMNGSGEMYITDTGILVSYGTSYDYGLRPAISLKLGTEFETGGDGTPTNPYVVKYN